MNVYLENYVVDAKLPFAEVFYRFSKTYPRNILLVVDEYKICLGVIGIKELVKCQEDNDFMKLNALDVCNRSFTTLTNIDYHKKALQTFYENDYNNLPIVTETGELVDLVSRIDFFELRMTSYTFGDADDIILAFVLRDTKNITYIDVGAFDPEYASVTKHFYDRGAHGINIEPQIKQFELLEKVRVNDVNINAICSDVDTPSVEFYNIYGGGSSTACVDYVTEKTTVSSVRAVTLANLVNEYFNEVDEISFLKIDVEGFEKQVLKGMDFTNHRPWIIMIESTIPNSDISTAENWEYLLLQNDYVFAKQYGVNRFYIDKKMADLLLPRFVDLETMKKRLVMSTLHQNPVLSYS